MCSNEPGRRPAAELAARLSAIDEVAAAASAGDGTRTTGGGGAPGRAWALIAAADPELAARTARY